MAVDHHGSLIPEGPLPATVLRRLVGAGLTEDAATALGCEALPLATAMATKPSTESVQA
ncbi:hypothetical protein [Nocardiopsis sp. BMP B8015]|uniref:hypothetical protein n=1 Tax=Nocardiopsis sp. BMP B8015 TaxID=2044268 RepID=UPI001872DE6C|nr:hypothetical protein [Nocardiopsis sp. BMP B8015]